MKANSIKNKKKSLIITSLFMCIVLLLLLQIKMSATLAEQEEQWYELDIEKIEEIEQFIEELATSEVEKIETHKAYNESENSQNAATTSQRAVSQKSNLEKYIEELEQERENEQLVAMSSDAENTISSYKKYEKKETQKSQAKEVVKGNDNEETVNKKTSNYYHLTGRKIVYFPNPVYTCNAFGKIVINITVDTYGSVINTEYNTASSTSSNGCLIDQALLYAQQAKFNKETSKPQQIGTITYIFPGQ